MWSRSTVGPAACRSGACRAGFTLLEALIALVVLGLAISMALQAFGAGSRAQRRVRIHIEAVALAEARMSELALLPPDSLRRYRTMQQGVFAPPFERYRWRAIVRPDAASAALLQAAVLVEWSGGDFALETFFRQRDPLSPGGS